MKNTNRKFKLIKICLQVAYRKLKMFCHQAPLNIMMNVDVKEKNRT